MDIWDATAENYINQQNARMLQHWPIHLLLLDVKEYWDLLEVKVLSLLHLILTQNCLWSQALTLDIIDVKQNQMSWPIMSSSTVLLLLFLLWLVNTCTIYWWSVNFENIKVLNAIINFFLYNVFVFKKTFQLLTLLTSPIWCSAGISETSKHHSRG